MIDGHEYLAKEFTLIYSIIENTIISQYMYVVVYDNEELDFFLRGTLRLFHYAHY